MSAISYSLDNDSAVYIIILALRQKLRLNPVQALQQAKAWTQTMIGIDVLFMTGIHMI